MYTQSNKPWTTAQFEQNRPHLTEWVRNEIVPVLEDNLSRPIMVVRAPVKSGKREIAEYLAMRDEGIGSPRVHVFLSAWHRTADASQRRELSLHNMKVFSINNKTAADSCIRWIRETTENHGKHIVLHLDECDHGSGDKQILGKVYVYVRENERVFTILYSATPEEVLFSSEMRYEEEEDMLDDLLHGTHVEYKPPAGFYGPGHFLRENLVHDAKPFFTMNPVPALTEQGRQIIRELKQSTLSGGGRNIMVLRLTKKDGKKKEGKEIYKFLCNIRNFPELEGVSIWVDKNDCDTVENTRKIDWSCRDYWVTTTKDVPILIVHDMTSSRSTEWACHDRIFATHDYRTSLTFAMLSQAQERPNHFHGKYEGGFQTIKIYGHKKTFQLSAGIINYGQYLECEWIMRKVDARRSAADIYEIKNREGEIHPQFQSQFTKEAAESALRSLGCFGEFSLSSRVSGKIRQIPIFDTRWFPCTSAASFTNCMTNFTVENDLFRGRTFLNPFLHDRRPLPEGPNFLEKGYLRGWGVFDYETDIITQPGWGVSVGTPRLTICYREGVLGVAVRWHTGRFKHMNRLSAYRSMYPSIGEHL